MQSLMKSRGGLVGTITKIEGFIQACQDDLSLTTKQALMSQLETLKSVRGKYQEIQQQIIDKQESDSRKQNEHDGMVDMLSKCSLLEQQLEKLLLEAQDFNDSFTQEDLKKTMQDLLLEQEKRHTAEINKLFEKIATLSAPQKDIPSDQDSKSKQETSTSGELSDFIKLLADKLTNTNTSPKPSYTKLPEMSLPTFSGKFSDWIPFRDQFNSSITRNPHLTDSQKLQYLNSSLSGEAASAVKRIPITDANFLVAWKILERRFDKKYNIIMDHIQNFQNAPSVTTFNLKSFSELCVAVSESVEAVRAMDVEHFDLWLIHQVLQKIDQETKLLWSKECEKEIPTWDQFITFLFNRRDNYESAGVSNPVADINPAKTNSSHNSHKKSHSALVASGAQNCKFCNESAHALFKCAKFIALSPEERFQAVKRLHLCRNCISSNHQTHQCNYRTCQKCNGRHNILLHESYVSYSARNSTTTSNRQGSSTNSRNSQQTSTIPPTSQPSTSTTPSSVNVTHSEISTNQSPNIFLATAIVDVLDEQGRRIQCRALLDSGAQINLMSANFMRKLNLPKCPTSISVLGIGAHSSQASHSTEATIFSRNSNDHYNLQCFVVPKITGNLPNCPVDNKSLVIPPGIQLADPTWYLQKPIDLLIGGESYWDIILDGTIELGEGKPKLKPTTFGHIIVGKLQQVSAYCNLTVLESLNQTLSRFWEIEGLPEDTQINDEHRDAEEHFMATHSRTPEGRFVVELPFKRDINGQIPRLGDSRHTAIRQLHNLERRFQKNPTLKRLYVNVMHDYLDKGWMERVPESEVKNYSYYMPHHGVLKDSTSTQLRIVYNGSSKTTNGLSLNDILLVGPTVHSDVFDVLLRFRLHEYAVMADITKMYHQLILHPEHTNFQRLVWREHETDPICDYRITRVGFGLGSSPFLATRALVQLAHEHQLTHSLASEAILKSFYVDDCLFSAESPTIMNETCLQLVDMLGKGGFVLAKWMFSHPSIQKFDSELNATTLITDSTKALGLRWTASSDTFNFVSPIPLDQTKITKRSIASDIAKIFDPLGLIGPVVVTAKIILQELHQLKGKWDDEVPAEYGHRWHTFSKSIQNVHHISVQRWIRFTPSMSQLELHGFCDASTKAYGAAIYAITRHSTGEIHSILITSKSRVAPLKTQTVPRLELCGALLLATLMKKVQEIMTPTATHYWTDSSIVLAWINSTPSVYKVFVSNRVKRILEISNPVDWGHVPTASNPADLISRGLSPALLSCSSLWWSGPTWLTREEHEWPRLPNLIHQRPSEEFKDASISLTIANEQSFFETFVEKSSSLRTLQIRLAWCLRFAHNSCNTHSKRTGTLSVEELEFSLRRLIYLDQHQCFPKVVLQLKIGRELPSSWKHLQPLSPYLDSEGLVRVGGRLEKSDESMEAKHPILLTKSKLQELIAINEHRRLLHAPPALLLASLRQRFWPIGGRNLVRKIVRQCYTCVRARPRPLDQIMGQLPAHRVVFNRPFHATAVDYAGPLIYKTSHLRNAKTSKGYICLFVCMSVKALHLELVTDMTTEAFLAAFRRFVSRRSAPRHMYSDCGTTFVGANKQLCQLYLNEKQIAAASADSGTIWHFNPPGAPHQGGLWEAGVKSVKYHLHRTLNQSLHTFEEISTMLHQIEATLNSRPISLMSDDPTENNYLTPGHFLVGAPLTSLPDPDLSHLQTNQMNRWQLCQRQIQEFAKRWRYEYLNTLQQRTKWRIVKPNLKKGDVVLTLDDITSKWTLARVEDIHPGKDGLVRVISLRNAKSIFKRPITKVAVLPMDSSGHSPSPGEGVTAVSEKINHSH